MSAELSEFFLSYKVGDIIYPLKSNLGKFAHAIIKAKDLKSAESLWESFKEKAYPEIKIPTIERAFFRKEAKKNFNAKFCWVCRICDGMNCASAVPGMGGVGDMRTFQENIQSLQSIKIIPNYLEKKVKISHNSLKIKDRETETLDREVSLKTSVLGVSMNAPLLTAPITGGLTNMGGSISEWDYAFETGWAAKNLGLIPTFGDGASPDKYWTGLRAIEKLKTGFPVFKPREDMSELKRRIREAGSQGARAWGMDVDGVWFKTMLQKKQKTKRKNLSELIELKNSSDLPFFLKGIMSLEDARLACEAGAKAVIVSNHGGRVLDHLPATSVVLPEIADFVHDHFPTVEVLVDGGIRSGGDIFKMLALGAKAVLVGRPVAIAAVAYQRFGVYDLLNKYIDELRKF